MCPATLEMSLTTNRFNVPVGPVWAQGESLESCPEPNSTRVTCTDPQLSGPFPRPHLSRIMLPETQLGVKLL